MKKITEAIILAGGFGTRLQHIVNDVPKPMAPINGVPFLSFLIKKLIAGGIEHIIMSTGHLHEKIQSYYSNTYEGVKLTYSHESSPLGTGGAIMFALDKAITTDVLVLNGDTLFDIDLLKFSEFYAAKNTSLAVALRHEKDVARYGSVITDSSDRITAFTEKNEITGEGFINGGIYLLHKSWLSGLSMPEQFSFEKEILEKQYRDTDMYGMAFDNYFIDIGIPEDYARAQHDFISLTFR